MITHGSRAIAIGAAVAAVVAGCGSSGSNSRPTAPLNQAVAQELPAAPTGTHHKSAPAPASTLATPPARTYAVRPFVEVEKRVLTRLRAYQANQQQQRKLTAAEEVQASLATVRDLTDAVLIASGLEFATFDLANGGRKVTVNVDKKSACQLTAADQEKIESRIVGASDTVEQVRLRIEGSSLAVERYLKTQCPKPIAPSTVGRLLIRKAGSGTVELPAIQVTTPNWKIDYQSWGALLQVYVYHDGKLQKLAVNRRDRGAGTATLKGPGKFTLHVAGTGHWKLRAYAVPASQPTSG